MWRQRLKVPILIVVIPLAAIALHLAVIRPLIGLALTGSKEYVYRSYAWGNSDIFDYEKFPWRPVENAAPSFQFKAASADEAFVPPEGFEALLEASGTTAFLIIQDDVLTYERYLNGFQRELVVHFLLRRQVLQLGPDRSGPRRGPDRQRERHRRHLPPGAQRPGPRRPNPS